MLMCCFNGGLLAALRRYYRIGVNSRAGAISLQYVVQHIIDRIDEDNLHFIAKLSGDVVKVVFIAPWQRDCTNSGTAGGEHFFLDATDRQNLAT